MAKGNLTFLVGLPRSGKSTIAKRWLDWEVNIENMELLYVNLGPGPRPRVVVSDDAIRLALGHRYNHKTESLVEGIKYPMIRALLLDHDVLVDDTHTTASHIKRLFEIDHDAQYYVVPTHPDTCKNRARFTEQSDVIPVIDRMYINLKEMTMNTMWENIVKGLPFFIETIRSKTIPSDRIGIV